jgi:hypothetical protein
MLCTFLRLGKEHLWERQREMERLCCWLTNLKIETQKEEEENEARRFNNVNKVTDELVTI